MRNSAKPLRFGDKIPERRKIGTLLKFRLFSEIWEKNELFSPVPKRESLIIDNTNLSAEATAQKIIEHYNLA